MLHTFTVLVAADGSYIANKGKYHGELADSEAMIKRAQLRTPGYVQLVPLSKMPAGCRQLVEHVASEEGRAVPSLVRVWTVTA
jgi:hypothetical protein